MPTLIVACSASEPGGGALGDLGAQVLAQLQRARGVGLRHQHRELVAGEAGDDVGGPHPLAHDRGDVADQVVAGVVAERVVDRLEAVDVDDHHRALAAVAGGEGDVLVELGAEAAAVEQAGERVVIGEVAQLGLGLLGLGKRLSDDLAVLGVELGEHRLDRRIALDWERFAWPLTEVRTFRDRIGSQATHELLGLRTSFGYPPTANSGRSRRPRVV